MARFVAAALEQAARTGGLLDPTLLAEIQDAGYTGDSGEPLALAQALAAAPPRAAGGGDPRERWRAVSVDAAAYTVTRPVGLGLDSGGVVKGMCADLMGSVLARSRAYAVDCGGDLRIGGSAGTPRAVRVTSPFDGSVVHELALREGGVATSGIGKRSWRGADGRPAHHLLDPATGRPVFSGVVQATAIAPTALQAEADAKAALLSGPLRGREWLPYGGVLVLDDGTVEVVPARELTL
jgi:thiamine biosynthesis lipoprotein